MADDELSRWSSAVRNPSNDRERAFAQWYKGAGGGFSRFAAFEAGFDAGVERAAERLEIMAGSPLCPAEHVPALRVAIEAVRKLVPGG